jgi:DNA-binding NtrC family response regulator
MGGAGTSDEPTVLVVDDDDAVGVVLASILEQGGFRATWVGSGPEALAFVDEAPPSLVITDLRMPGMSGFELMDALTERAPELPVAVVTAFGSIEVAVEAMKRGAVDFLTKPFERAGVVGLARRYVEHVPRERNPPPASGVLDATRSVVMRECLKILERAASTRATILLRGESGTGKELAARTIHAWSGRSGSFVAVHCGALPDQLLESELFGYEKGAFTGAEHRKPGRVELAEKGTLFLDEIGDISPNLQVKLLRLIQERTFEPLGGTSVHDADVRFVAATHRDLSAMVASGEFREDLYYRLAVIPVRIPSLAERHEDIADLARSFLERHRHESTVGDLELAADAIAELEATTWPGNVRQLQNLIERVAVFADHPQVGADVIRRELARDNGSELGAGPAGPQGPLDQTPPGRAATRAPSDVLDHEAELRRARVDAMLEAYRRAGRNWSRAARLLGISRRTLYNWKREYGLDGSSPDQT